MRALTYRMCTHPHTRINTHPKWANVKSVCLSVQLQRFCSVAKISSFRFVFVQVYEKIMKMLEEKVPVALGEWTAGEVGERAWWGLEIGLRRV
jgi:hypothetical protein